MKTTIHTYNYAINTPTGLADYNTMCQSLQSLGLKKLRSWGGKPHYCPELDGHEIELDTTRLSNNQWNTVTGLRVFDWAEDYITGSAASWLRRGHYLKQTNEMRAARHDTVACGYCGHQLPAISDNVWCDKCIDSEYLTEDDLFLLRLQRIDDPKDRPPLSDTEASVLKKRFLEAQLYGSTERGRSRIAANYAKVERDYEIAVKNAENKKAAALWVLDHFPGLYQNWVYYNHTGKSCFGWRRPLTEREYIQLSSSIADFPGEYEIKLQVM